MKKREGNNRKKSSLIIHKGSSLRYIADIFIVRDYTQRDVHIMLIKLEAFSFYEDFVFKISHKLVRTTRISSVKSITDFFKLCVYFPRK